MNLARARRRYDAFLRYDDRNIKLARSAEYVRVPCGLGRVREAVRREQGRRRFGRGWHRGATA